MSVAHGIGETPADESIGENPEEIEASKKTVMIALQAIIDFIYVLGIKQRNENKDTSHVRISLVV